MLQRRTWAKIGTLGVFSAFLTCIVLGILVLTRDSTAKAGIATLTFNFTDIHLPNLIKPRTLPVGIQSSAVNILTTAISAAASKAQSATGTVETVASNIDAINTLIPRNCSLGTKQFCVGFSTYTKCNELPLNISDMIPEDIVKFVGNEFQALQPLQEILAKVTAVNIQDFLFLGLGLMLVMVILFVCLIRGLLTFGKKFVRLGICLVFGLLCLISFLIPTTILYYVQSKIQDLGSGIEVEKGDVGNLCLGAFLCAAITVITVIALVF